MGLGKTIEIIDLILLNPRPLLSEKTFCDDSGTTLREIKATLIITPPTIRTSFVSDLLIVAQSPNGQPSLQRKPRLSKFLSTLESKIFLRISMTMFSISMTLSLRPIQFYRRSSITLSPLRIAACGTRRSISTVVAHW